MGFLGGIFDDETRTTVVLICRDLVISLVVLASVGVFFLAIRSLTRIGVPQEWVTRLEKIDEDIAWTVVLLTGLRFLIKLWWGSAGPSWPSNKRRHNVD